MFYAPLLLTIVGGLFVLPFSMFFFVAKQSLVFSVSISMLLVIFYWGLGPLLYVKLTFYLASKNPEEAFRKHGYLSNFDEMN